MATPTTFRANPSLALLPPPSTRNIFLITNLITVDIIKKVPKKASNDVRSIKFT